MKIIKIVATRCHRPILKLKCTKFVFGRGSAPDLAGGNYDAPPDPLVGWGGGYPFPIPYPLDAFGVSVSASLVLLSDGLDTRPCKILDPPL